MTGDDMKDEGRVLVLDKPRRFHTTWNTMRALQKEYGSVETAMEKVAAGDYDAILYLLWAAQADDEKLALDELGDVIEPGNFEQTFSAAFSLADEPVKKQGFFHIKKADRPHR